MKEHCFKRFAVHGVKPFLDTKLTLILFPMNDVEEIAWHEVGLKVPFYHTY